MKTAAIQTIPRSNNLHPSEKRKKAQRKNLCVQCNTAVEATPSAELLKRYYLDHLAERRSEKISKAYAAQAKGLLPSEFHQKAEELISELGLSPDLKPQITNILINEIGLRTLSTKVIKENVFLSTQILNIPYEKFTDMALKQPQLFYRKPETLAENVSQNAEYLGISKEKYIEHSFKTPSILFQKPETLKANVIQSAALFDIPEKEYIKIAAKNPQLFYQKPETLNKNITQCATQLDIPKDKLLKAALKQTALFCQKPKTIVNNVFTSSRLLNISSQEFINSALKFPPLFCTKPETLKENVVKSAVLLEVSPHEFSKAALKHPPLFCHKPEKLKHNAETSAKLLGIPEKSFVKYALRNPSYFSYNPETLYKHSKMLQYTTEIKKSKTRKSKTKIRTWSEKYIWLDLLRHLISKHEHTAFNINKPEKTIKEYLSQNPEKMYSFNLPNNEYAGNFIEFSQKLSEEILNKNVFCFDIEP